MNAHRPVYPGGTPARDAARAALLEALAVGPPPPCDPERACHDRADVRAKVAAEVCPSCPFLDVCREAGRFERWHVWGGRDRTAARSKRRDKGVGKSAQARPRLRPVLE